MSVDSQPELEHSRLPPSNSVETCTDQSGGSDETEAYEDRIERRVDGCVENLIEEYPYLAHMPLAESDGLKLRSLYVEEEYVEEHVEEADYVRPEDRSPGAPEEQWNNGFTIERLARRESVTVAEGLRRFLEGRQKYDDGVTGVFETVDGDEFTKQFTDSWTAEYGDEQSAKNAAAQRQLCGGEYPENEDSERSGESVDGEWSDDIATVMLTRTGSSIPNGQRVPLLEHANAVTRTWSKYARDVCRNVCEYHLGLDPGQWYFVGGDEPHGMSSVDDSEDYSGENACYLHSHDAVYLDLGETDLRRKFDSDEEIIAVLTNLFFKVIEKHVEECRYAKPSAHTKDESVDVRLDLENPAAYASAYLNLDEETPMLERSVEFQVFAMQCHALGLQRVTRSKLANDAAKADFCLQHSDSTHGERLKYDRHGNVVCAECGSGVGIDADTITEFRLKDSIPAVLDDDHSDDPDDDHGEVPVGDTVVAASISEPLRDIETMELVGEYVEEHGELSPSEVLDKLDALIIDERERLREFVELHGSPGSVPAVVGQLELDPDRFDEIRACFEVLSGNDPADGLARELVSVLSDRPTAEVVTEAERNAVTAVLDGQPEPQTEVEYGFGTVESEYELKEIALPDGSRETPSGGGGSDMVELKLPEKRLIERTDQLRKARDGFGTIRCPSTGVTAFDPNEMAEYLITERGVRTPREAEQMLQLGW